MHDDCVDRTCNGIGKIRDLNLKEIRRMDATINARSSVSAEPPPQLSELLDLVKDYPDVLLNIELKDYPQDDEAFA